MAINDVIKLKEFQTRTLFELETRTAGTYRLKLLIEGNSLLSTVFVESASGSVKVNYFESTTGDLVSERKDLPSHPLISAANTSDPNKITCTPFHNSPEVEVIVTGTVRFSVYATVVASFATDLDAALQFDGTTHVPTEDKGLPSMCLDVDTGLLNFIRCKDGGLLINGSVSLAAVSSRLYGTALIADTVTSTLISHTPTVDQKIIQIKVGGDGYGEFDVKINGTIWAKLRNSWNDRTVIQDFNSKALTTSDTITVEATNVSIGGGGSCTYEAFVYLGV